ncbi:NADPH dehydrogenase [Polychaeton citri CBS 116435]|uniref:NADPH dehydrogenase n=1 Tax=Polychaeton citri CBS 116435 TaxID=1314669 RepID=A0A9P4ULK3_9PEZI|nr:NADPH dehydrogenase [Polychaeton citri CBS 116435]
MSTNRLFKPLRLGHLDLKHRVMMAPLTRFRADENHVQLPFVKEYYEQRAAVPGTFIITEATFISPQAGGYNNVPGLWNTEQVAAWKEITEAVHAKGSYIYCQLWALGRVAVPQNLKCEGGFDVVTSSTGPLVSGGAVKNDQGTARGMTKEEIESYIQDYANAARNAIDAGFDGVELHGANGYLIDQFWQDTCNKRTDEYGGSVENRARFGLEVTRAVIDAVGGDSKKVGMRLSPWSTFQDMRMEDPIPQFSHIVKELKKLDLAYLHLVESRVKKDSSAADGGYHAVTRENDPFVELWGTQAPILLAGGFDPVKAQKVLSEVYTAENVGIAFGRYFISTPDLPFRIEKGIELTPYNRDTFYKQMSKDGYVDYPFSEEWLKQQSESKL